MRILHVIDNLKLGGTQNLAWRTWRGFAEESSVGLCVLTTSQNEHQWEWLPDDVYRLNAHGDYRKPGSVRKWSRMLHSEVLAEFKPDLVHSWLWLSDVVSAGAAAKASLPHLVHVVDRRTWQESQKLRHRYRKWMTRRLFAKANSQFLGVSQAAADYAVDGLQIDSHKMGVAFNSIDTDSFAAIPDSSAWMNPDRPLRLGIAARIVPEKGHRYLLEAVKILMDRAINVELQITGDGPDRKMLEQFVIDHGLQDSVRFVGWVDSVTNFLGGVDLFMVPSIDSEGLPTTILEAMAAGRIVIATDIGGAIEAITPETGYIVPAKHPGALADAVMSVYRNRQHAGAMSTAARKRIKAVFDMPRMLETIENQYRSLITKPGHNNATRKHHSEIDHAQD